MSLDGQVQVAPAVEAEAVSAGRRSRRSSYPGRLRTFCAHLTRETAFFGVPFAKPESLESPLQTGLTRA